MIHDLRQGQVRDLVITFGNQTRHKCPGCKQYMSAKVDDITCKCGASYKKVSDRQFQVLTVPR